MEHCSKFSEKVQTDLSSSEEISIYFCILTVGLIKNAWGCKMLLGFKNYWAKNIVLNQMEDSG